MHAKFYSQKTYTLVLLPKQTTPKSTRSTHAGSAAFPDEAAGVFLRDFTEVRAAQIFSEKRAAAATLGC